MDPKEFAEMTTHGPEFLYRVLSRMQADCRYYLGNGHRRACCLWARDERNHIDLMRTIYRYLAQNFEAPEWIDEAEISSYEEQICPSPNAE